MTPEGKFDPSYGIGLEECISVQLTKTGLFTSIRTQSSTPLFLQSIEMHPSSSSSSSDDSTSDAFLPPLIGSWTEPSAEEADSVLAPTLAPLHSLVSLGQANREKVQLLSPQPLLRDFTIDGSVRRFLSKQEEKKEEQEEKEGEEEKKGGESEEITEDIHPTLTQQQSSTPVTPISPRDPDVLGQFVSQPITIELHPQTLRLFADIYVALMLAMKMEKGSSAQTQQQQQTKQESSITPSSILSSLQSRLALATKMGRFPSKTSDCVYSLCSLSFLPQILRWRECGQCNNERHGAR